MMQGSNNVAQDQGSNNVSRAQDQGNVTRAQDHAQAFNPKALLLLITSNNEFSSAPFTIKSNATGKDFTYKIRRNEYKDRWYTHVEVEVDYLSFRYLGFYDNGKLYRKGRTKVDGLAAISIGWVLHRMSQGLSVSAVTFYHTGRCIRCGHELTDATSIELGLGPICRTL